MHRTTPYIASVILAAAGICAVRAQSKLDTPAQTDAKSEVSAQDNADCTKLIRRYRAWTKVNPKPFQMQPAVSAACAAAAPSLSASPHVKKFVTVYVNDLGKKAMTTQKSPMFPVGSVIVKEKLTRPDSKSSELMTVMVKREKNFNRDCGDWEFIVFDGTGTKVTAKGKLENCGSCHRTDPAIKSDFVFRSYYLPEEKLAALK